MRGGLAWDKSLFGILIRHKDDPQSGELDSLVESLRRGEYTRLRVLIKRRHDTFMVAFMFRVGHIDSVSKRKAEGEKRRKFGN